MERERLINADAFEKFIKEKYADGEKAEDIKEQMLFDLSCQPTAYDVDTVVERLEDITSEQICKEGIEVEEPYVLNGEEKRYAISSLWNSTIKKSDLDCYGWDANPYVFVIEFERCKKPEES